MKAGFKQTEIGWIPDDWDVRGIKEISTPVRGGSPRPAGSPRYFNGSFIPWLTVASLTNISPSKIFVERTDSFLTEEGSWYSRRLDKGTLIISNSGATLGVSKILNIQCCANDGIAALLDLKLDKVYVSYFINSLTQQLRTAIATGNGQPNLNTTLIGNLQIPIPPPKEQEAIAEALSNTDAWIDSLEALLQKKRHIKQGAMQELLRPKEGWQVITLGQCLKYVQPTPFLVKSTEYHSQGLTPVLTAGKTFILGYTNESEGIFTQVPTIIFDDFTTSSHFVNFPFKVKSSAIKMLLLNDENLDFRFIFNVLQAVKFHPGDHKRHWIGEFQNMEVLIPDPTEQSRLAVIISDMDAEIDSLEQKLSKARQIKKGMMQQLLTGQIRLVKQTNPKASETSKRVIA